jgi:diacylglycerol kinase family enzyme
MLGLQVAGEQAQQRAEVFELANGFLQRASGADELPPIGLVPLGSGNALASDFRQNQRRRGEEVSIYRELDAVADWAMDRVIAGRSCCMDVLEIESRGERIAAVALLFLGLVADVDVVAEPFRWMGPVRFDVAAVWNVLKQRAMPPCTIEVLCPDGQTRRLSNPVGNTQDSSAEEEANGPAWLSLAIDLGQHWSDSTRSSPTSQLDDGVAELHILKMGSSRTQLLTAFGALSTGAHVSMEGVENFVQTVPFKELRICFPAVAGNPIEGLFNVDGEMFCHDGSLSVRVLPRKLRMFCNPDDECHNPDADVSITGESSAMNTYTAHPIRWFNMLFLPMQYGESNRLDHFRTNCSHYKPDLWRCSRCRKLSFACLYAFVYTVHVSSIPSH